VGGAMKCVQNVKVVAIINIYLWLLDIARNDEKFSWIMYMKDMTRIGGNTPNKNFMGIFER
jgi:hypothetical protein